MCTFTGGLCGNEHVQPGEVLDDLVLSHGHAVGSRVSGHHRENPGGWAGKGMRTKEWKDSSADLDGGLVRVEDVVS